MHDDVKRMLKYFDTPVNRWDEALNAITDQLDSKSPVRNILLLLTRLAEKRGKILYWISPEPYR